MNHEQQQEDADEGAGLVDHRLRAVRQVRADHPEAV